MCFSTCFSSSSISTNIDLNWWKRNILIYYYVKRWLLTTGQKHRPHIYKSVSAKNNKVRTNLTQERLMSLHLKHNLVDFPLTNTINKTYFLLLFFHFHFLVKQPSFLSLTMVFTDNSTFANIQFVCLYQTRPWKDKKFHAKPFSNLKIFVLHEKNFR